MGQKLSHREQRAADIRDSLLWYRDHRPSDWDSQWRSEAVRRGVARNNARRSEDDDCCRRGGCCCSCFGLLIVVGVLFGLAWYAWSRALQAGHQMVVDYPGLVEPSRYCGNGSAATTSVVRAINCTWSFYSRFSQSLAQVWSEMVVME